MERLANARTSGFNGGRRLYEPVQRSLHRLDPRRGTNSTRSPPKAQMGAACDSLNRKLTGVGRHGFPARCLEMH